MTKVERHECIGVNNGEGSLLKGSLEESDVAGYCLSTMLMIMMDGCFCSFIQRV